MNKEITLNKQYYAVITRVFETCMYVLAKQVNYGLHKRIYQIL